jgi:hypothetical protein
MASDFLLRVVHRPSGDYVEWAPGQYIESHLVDELCNRVRAKGVGLGRTTNHVVEDVRAAITELLFELKKQV